jgi:hypothetical protein
LHDAPDGGGAAGGEAGVAFATIDLKAVLEVAKFAIGLTVIAQGGAAGGDRLGQHVADEGDEGGGAGLAMRPALRAGWMRAR